MCPSRCADGGQGMARADGDQSNEEIDWLGRPVKDTDTALGGWTPAFFISSAACCGYMAYGGVFFNLVLYLMRERGASPAAAANDVTNLVGTTFFTSLVGAVVGDAYLGRLWTVVLFLVIYVVGSAMLGAAVSTGGGGSALLYASLYVIAVGSGSYEPVIASLGGDQFREPAQKALFFSQLFVFCSLGQVLSLTALTFVENEGRWAVGFWISGAAVLASLPVFFLGALKCRQFKPGGNPLLRIAQVLVCAARRTSIRPAFSSPRVLRWPRRSSSSVRTLLDPHRSSAGAATQQKLHETEAGRPSVIPGSRKLNHTDRFRWLDRAATITSQDTKQLTNAWHLCTVTQVEEVKCLLHIFPFLVVGILYNATIAQVGTLFVEQAATMDTNMGSHFNIPPGSMALFLFITSILFAPVYDYILAPICRKRTGHEKGLRTLQRMGVGIFICIGAMVVAAKIENKRLKVARETILLHDPTAIVPLSVYWLVPQFVVLGVSFVFTVVAQMDFFYSELSDGMKSIGMCLTLMTRGLGNYVSTLLVTIVTHITTQGGNLGWLPRNLNEGRIDNLYWLLAIMMFITLIFHLVAANFYTYLYIGPKDSLGKDSVEVEMNFAKP